MFFYPFFQINVDFSFEKIIDYHIKIGIYNKKNIRNWFHFDWLKTAFHGYLSIWKIVALK